jgi:hypothetical protein
MSYINPLAASFAQTTGASRAAATDRNRESRQNSTSHVLPTAPEKPDVETRDAVDLHEEQHQSDNGSRKRKKRPPPPPTPDTPNEGLDIRA